MRIIVLELWYTNLHNYLDIHPPFFFCIINYEFLTHHMCKIFKYLYIPMQFCHEKHTANIQMKISEHGAFPLVSVWVWHGEPGNMHPYNFEQTSPLG